jgi:hypothetical protein
VVVEDVEDGEWGLLKTGEWVILNRVPTGTPSLPEREISTTLYFSLIWARG